MPRTTSLTSTAAGARSQPTKRESIAFQLLSGGWERCSRSDGLGDVDAHRLLVPIEETRRLATADCRQNARTRAAMTKLLTLAGALPHFARLKVQQLVFDGIVTHYVQA